MFQSSSAKCNRFDRLSHTAWPPWPSWWRIRVGLSAVPARSRIAPPASPQESAPRSLRLQNEERASPQHFWRQAEAGVHRFVRDIDSQEEDASEQHRHRHRTPGGVVAILSRIIPYASNSISVLVIPFLCYPLARQSTAPRHTLFLPSSTETWLRYWAMIRAHPPDEMATR